MEIWDEKLYQGICPGKSKNTSHEEFVHSIQNGCKDFWGGKRVRRLCDGTGAQKDIPGRCQGTDRIWGQMLSLLSGHPIRDRNLKVTGPLQASGLWKPYRRLLKSFVARRSRQALKIIVINAMEIPCFMMPSLAIERRMHPNENSTR